MLPLIIYLRGTLMLKIYLLILIFLCRSYSQVLGSIEGIVVDRNSKPLTYVSVYISNTTIGVYTDSLGNFKLKDIPLGDRTIVSSHPGFKSQFIQINLITDNVEHINFRLQQNIKSTKIVDILGKYPTTWRRSYKKFVRYFLGETKFSKQCEVINKFDLDFKEEQNSLFASSSKPIKVINHALGYEYYFEIETCIIKPPLITTIMVKRIVDISHLYEKKTVENNRKIVFKNSARRFLKSLYLDSLIQYDFQLGEYSRLGEYSYFNNKTITRDSIIQENSQYLGFKTFKFYKKVAVRHLNLTSEYDQEWLDLKYPKEKGFSFIDLSEESSFYFNNEGHILNRDANIVFQQYFAFYKNSGLLPDNYLM
jgi:hypothetical protein